MSLSTIQAAQQTSIRPAMATQMCLLLLLLILSAEILVVVKAGTPPIARRGCKDRCGDVSIPFPFGIGAGCFFDPWFEIECKTNGSKAAKPLLSKLNFEVMEINTKPEPRFVLPRMIVGVPPMAACTSTAAATTTTSIDLRETPFSFSVQKNVFIVEGCPGSAFLLGDNKTIVGGCGTVCNNNNSAMPATDGCYGVRCCQTPLPSDYFPSSFHRVVFNSQSCLVAAIVKSDSVNQYAAKLSSSDRSSAASVVLNWKLQSNLAAENIGPHATCSASGDGFYCTCNFRYFGNAYVSNGCQVPVECKRCPGYCREQYVGDRLNPPAHFCEKQPLRLAPILGLSISFGIVLLVIGLYSLYWLIKRRRAVKRRAKFFKRNGGLLLQQQLASNEGILEKTKIFTLSELDRATDSFNENRILGQGGQGTVYKGMLNDGKIVAIKKAKLLDESQLEQFTNEVVILSQINHRNVVKMLGCCLETEVPLLVYEFIPNGTLSQHIHDPDEDFVISWEMRLNIAADSAGAIAYLHSSSSSPIYHRDIKSSNILLDEKKRAKVSDFGSSRTIAIDQTHLTTLVQGTMGYLDPEYFQSYQFTEKSDVYSFGVVLLELLTGKKPIYRGETMEQKNLVTEFLFLAQSSRLSSILDAEIVKQAKEEELIAIVELAKCCLRRSGRQRPTMKEVAMALEMIMTSPAQAFTWYNQSFRIPAGGFAENAITEASDAKFMSNPLPARVPSPMYIDVHPLLHDTI